MVFYSRTYNLLDWQQAQDRIHRVGQELPVTIACLVAQSTIDNKVDRALRDKIKLQDGLFSQSRNLEAWI